MRWILIAAAVLSVSSCHGGSAKSSDSCGSMYTQFVHDYYSEHGDLPDAAMVDNWRVVTGCR